MIYGLLFSAGALVNKIYLVHREAREIVLLFVIIVTDFT